MNLGTAFKFECVSTAIKNSAYLNFSSPSSGFHIMKTRSVIFSLKYLIIKMSSTQDKKKGCGISHVCQLRIPYCNFFGDQYTS